MTQAIYTATAEYADESQSSSVKRRVSVSGILKHLGVSRSGYNSWRYRHPSQIQKRRNALRERIRELYDESHQNYGAPKITQKLRREGETIAQRTVGTYMRQMGLRAQWVKHYTRTTVDPDFSS